MQRSIAKLKAPCLIQERNTACIRGSRGISDGVGVRGKRSASAARRKVARCLAGFATVDLGAGGKVEEFGERTDVAAVDGPFGNFEIVLLLESLGVCVREIGGTAPKVDKGPAGCGVHDGVDDGNAVED
eukprot:SAG31_NODE_3403_length_4306_cov_3.734156_2_plen_129_part_00